MQAAEDLTEKEIRWKIASDFSDYIPYMYDEEFRKISQGRCDAKITESEKKIWKEAGIRQKVYANTLRCPLKNAADIAGAYSFISKAILGPELKRTIQKEKNDSARIITDSCPLLRIAIERGTDTRRTSGICTTFSKSAIENLNPSYRLIVENSMCEGDADCEMLVVKKRS